MKDLSHFKIKAYGKAELAMLYFPYSGSCHTATTHLMSWVKRNTPLMEALKAQGYRPSAKGFTPKEVALIVEFLGEP